MYIPASFSETDAVTLYQFMRANNFATLVTSVEGQLTATHLPFLADAERGVLRAHLARAKTQWKCFDGREALVIFQGPHAYISPTWYEVHPNVPTWNYTAVHVYGTPRIIDDETAVHSLLGALVEQHERGRQPEWHMELPEDYMYRMMQAIVGFEFPITRIEGKFKLSQNRPGVDVDGVIAGLTSSPAELDRGTGALMARWREGAKA
jgi:transcriptional regulator